MHKFVFLPFGNSLALKNLSKTRWTARAEAVKAVHISYEKILDSLFKIKNLRDVGKTNKMQSQAAALYKKMLEFDFICSIFFSKNIMYKLKNLTEQLEKVELNVLDALQLIKSTVESFNLIKNDSEQINLLIESAILFAKKIGVNVEDFAKHHRTRHRPQRIDENTKTTATLDLRIFYQREFLSVLDRFIMDTTENLENILKFFRPFEEIFHTSTSRKNYSMELM